MWLSLSGDAITHELCVRTPGTDSIGSNWIRSAYRIGFSSVPGVRTRVMGYGIARKGKPQCVKLGVTAVFPMTRFCIGQLFAAYRTRPSRDYSLVAGDAL